MSTRQAALQRTGHSSSVVAVLVATAFAIGALTGFGIPRIIGLQAHADSPSGGSYVQKFKGVADNNMSDAAYRSRFGAGMPWFKGVAENSMSDAAYRSRYRGR